MGSMLRGALRVSRPGQTCAFSSFRHHMIRHHRIGQRYVCAVRPRLPSTRCQPQQRKSSAMSTLAEETAVQRVKEKWESTFEGLAGQTKWEGMSEAEQRGWFQAALEGENIDAEGSSGFVDVEAEWAAIAAGTHAPTDVAG